MANNHQFSIAVHLMAGLAYSEGRGMTSDQLAQSVNASPSFVRRTLSKLSKAHLVSATKGKSGKCELGKAAKEISLLDIYDAVEAPKVFSVHQYPAQKSCQVSCGIKSSLENVLSKTQSAMEDSLRQTPLSEVLDHLRAT